MNSTYKYTLSATRVLLQAQRISQAQGITHIDLVQLVESLFTDQRSLFYLLLRRLNFDFAMAIEQVRSISTTIKNFEPVEGPSGLLISARLFKFLEAAKSEADLRFDNWLGTEHMLLALFQSSEPDMQELFGQFSEKQTCVREILGSYQGKHDKVQSIARFALAKRSEHHPGLIDEVSRTKEVTYHLRRLAATGLHEKLSSAIAEAVDGDQANYMLRIIVSDIQYETQNYHEAMLHLGIAVALVPTNPVAYRRMASIAIQIGKRELAEALLTTGWTYYKDGCVIDHADADSVFWFGPMDQ